MNMNQRYHWRKATDINRDFAFFELVQDGVPLLDVGYPNAGKLELTFNPSIVGQVIPYEDFISLLIEGRAMADLDR
jgi:hypothetical protein